MKGESSHPMPTEVADSPEEVRRFDDWVLVRVTPKGEEIWNRHMTKLYERKRGPANARPFKPDPLERDQDGYTYLPLAVIAHVFGEHLVGDSQDLPLEPTFKYPKEHPGVPIGE